jgi:hypothetical protein
VNFAYFTIKAVDFSETFNENTPPTNEPAYISSLGSGIYEAMSRGNKDAVWLMQVRLRCSLTLKSVKDYVFDLLRQQ